jgi:cytochrome c oxidase subunit IV
VGTKDRMSFLTAHTHSYLLGSSCSRFEVFMVVTIWKMVSSGMLRHVALVRTDVSEELSASFIRVRRIGELGTLTVTSNWHMLWRNTCRVLVTAIVVPSSLILVTVMKKARSSSETLVLTRSTRYNIPEHPILPAVQFTATYLSVCHILVNDD